MSKPDTLITVPNGDLPIEGTNKYLVLRDFWLKDICIKKGQIITDPVSKRWIQLNLIEPYNEQNQNSQNNDSIENITITDVFKTPKPDENTIMVTDAVEEHKRRGRPRKNEVIVEAPEKSEELLEEQYKE